MTSATGAIDHTQSEPIRIYATYPAVPWACPESVSIELPYIPPQTLFAEMLELLARIPYLARIAADAYGAPIPRDGGS